MPSVSPRKKGQKVSVFAATLPRSVVVEGTFQVGEGGRGYSTSEYSSSEYSNVRRFFSLVLLPMVQDAVLFGISCPLGPERSLCCSCR